MDAPADAGLFTGDSPQNAGARPETVAFVEQMIAFQAKTVALQGPTRDVEPKSPGPQAIAAMLGVDSIACHP